MVSRSPFLFPELEHGSPEFRTGILPSQRIREFIDGGYVRATVPIDESQIQPASLDLRLGPVAYRVRASFLPHRLTPVTKRLDELTMHVMDLTTASVLERHCVYIVPLLEELVLPANCAGRANPKSSTGRLDIFTRVITEYGNQFDSVPAGYKGKLYLEIAPRTFSVVVRQGCRLSQLRLLRGAPPRSDAQIVDLHEAETLVYGDDDFPADPIISGGLWLSVDLSGASGSGVVGYKARPYAPVIDLDLVDHYELSEFWETLVADERRQLILSPGEFYILASKERVSVPPGFTGEMVGYDASVGEFRVHYAGFFDPGFGYGGVDPRGARAVLEVRSHEVPFLVEDGQRVGRLVFDRLTSAPEKLYGLEIGSSYQRQELALGKQFRRA